MGLGRLVFVKDYQAQIMHKDKLIFEWLLVHFPGSYDRDLP